MNPKPEAPPAEPKQDSSGGFLAIFREWSDALIIAFILAMFIRVFVVELFKIPTGSMSPTLLGDEICYVDWNRDGEEDIVVLGRSMKQVFLRKGDHYMLDEEARVTYEDVNKWRGEGLIRTQNDRILVSKFAYWLKPPPRGDVVVFKVPEVIWDPQKPIYIKRVVGETGERIAFDGQLVVNGEPVTDPEFFAHWKYANRVSAGQFVERAEAKYNRTAYEVEIEELTVPEGAIYVFGDNTNNSTDGRVWGAVPIENVRGKAFVRYWPWKKMKFIR